MKTKLSTYFKAHYDLILLGGLFLLMFLFLFKPWIHGFDTVAYYSWLRSPIIDGDFDVANEFEYYGYGEERGRTATGHTYNEWAVGSAVLWLPFFLVAHGLSLLLNTLGFAVPVDGYAPQYIWAVTLGSTGYAFAGMLLMYRLSSQWFTKAISVMATIAIWLGGSLIFYMYSHPTMSHANDAFAYALFIFTWYTTRQREHWSRFALQGITAGLCALVRQMNAVFVFFILGEIAFQGIKNWRNTKRWQAIGTALLNAATFSLAWWLAYLPQIIVWRIVFGHWIEPNPYMGGVGHSLNWFQPKLLRVILSTNRGLFVWHPLYIFAVVGWGLLWQRRPRLAAFLIVNFLCQLYVVASWPAWHGALGFGQRFFVNMAPAFVLGLGMTLDTMQKRIPLQCLAVGCFLFVIWNGLLLIRYALEDIPRGGYVPLDDFVIGQFTIIPRKLNRIVQVLMTRQ